ncbi:unnamed protein product, partial [Didymodactylos carnosus]
TEEYWLWSAVIAFNEIDKELLGLNEFRSFTPCGSVCFGLDKKSDDQYSIRTDVKGVVYCFLPTSMDSGLPFHINGCFALHTDRRRLLQKFVDDRNKRQFEWNDLVLKAVCKALLLGLENALTVCGLHSFEILKSFWPIPIKSPSLKALETTFLSSIIDPLKSYAIFSDGKQVGCFQQCWILNVDFPKTIQDVLLDELRSNLMHVLQNNRSFRHWLEAYNGKTGFSLLSPFWHSKVRKVVWPQATAESS